MLVDEMIAESQTAGSEPSQIPKPPKGKFALHTIGELMAMPSPDWLIEGMVEAGALAILYGPSGSGKSFAALDWALSVATGSDWQGRKVKKGPVVYVAAEGRTGIVRRVAAWRKHNGLEKDPIIDARVILEAPLLIQPTDLGELVKAIKELATPPTLIVLDTLARCFVGGEENSAKDMGQFVDACRQLHRHTAATVLVIHHTGKANAKTTPVTERGSSALRAAADVVISQVKRGDVVVITNDKQKDDEEFKPLSLRLKPIDLGTDPETKRLRTSCVLVESEPQDEAISQGHADSLNAREEVALAALANVDVATSGQWQGEVSSLMVKDIPDRSFQRWREKLVRLGLVESAPDDGPHSYRVTAKGKAHANGTPVGT
jgi:putative DNA primase/helicase